MFLLIQRAFNLAEFRDAAPLTSRDMARLMSLLSVKLQTSSPSSSSSVLMSCFNPSMHSSSEAFALPVTPAMLHALLKLFMASSNPVLVSWTVFMGALHSEKKTSNWKAKQNHKTLKTDRLASSNQGHPTTVK